MSPVHARDELAAEGFAHIGLLTSAEVAAARRVAEALDVPEDAGFWTTNVHTSRETATAASEALMAIGRPALRRALPGLRVTWAAVLAKGACGDNWVMPHQDWDHVDERHERSWVLWCPLADAATEDGVLHVVPGSHRWLDNRRGSGAIPEPYAPHADLLRGLGTGAGVAAGEAIIYDSAALHYSPPNDGRSTRLVMGLVVVPEHSQPIHLHADDDRGAALFHIDPTIFTSRPFRARPPGEPAEILPFGQTSISEDEIRARVAAHR